jgi:hypothetical protein
MPTAASLPQPSARPAQSLHNPELMTNTIQNQPPTTNTDRTTKQPVGHHCPVLKL